MRHEKRDRGTRPVRGIRTLHPALLVGGISTCINTIIFIEYQKSPYARFLLWDSANYWHWARDIAGGNWIGSTIFHQTPLYPYLLALCIRLFGERLLPVYLLQGLISIATSMLVYSLSAKVTGSKRTGLLSGIIYACYGLQVFYSTKILSECLAAFLAVCTVRLLLVYGKNIATVLAGVVFGLLLLIKPYFLMALPFIVLRSYLTHRRSGLRCIITHAGMMLVPVLLLLAMVTLRNFRVGHEFVLISGNGGENFYIGNNEKAHGTFTPIKGVSTDIAFQDADVTAQAREAVGKPLTRSEVSRYWFTKGLSFIKNNPAQYLALEWVKLQHVFSSNELTNMYQLRFEKKYLTRTMALPFVTMYLLFPLFCAGLVVAVGSLRTYYLPLLIIAVNILSILIFFYDSRFMLPMMPFFILVCGSGLRETVRCCTLGTLVKTLRQPVCIACGIGCLLVPLINARNRHVPSREWYLWHSLGDSYFGLDDLDRSLEYFAKASELNKEAYLPAFGVIKIVSRKGFMERAAQLYSTAFATLKPDEKKNILRDHDLDQLRDYIRIRRPADMKKPDVRKER